jgi:hypothetical protein
MRRARSFQPPIEESAGDLLTLQVRAAELDRRGNVLARVEAWNGSLVHGEQANLSIARARKQFADATAAALSRNLETAPPADVAARHAAAVEQTLVQLDAKLHRELADDTTAGSAHQAPDPEALWTAARLLAEAPDLLDRFDATMRALGLVGERQNARLVYLAATARLLPEPVNVVVKGPSSAGKSHLLKQVSATLPPSAYVDYTSVSPKYLAYADDDLRHRIVLLYEAGGIADGIGAYIMRSLLSEGRLDCGTVDKSEAGGNAARRLVKQGPTALFTSTTRSAVDAELETRVLSVGILDTPAHSRAILAGQAERATGAAPSPPDLALWHALQAWLAVAGVHDARVPFAPALAALVPPQTLRIRRDFPKLLSLVKACALLHQVQRERAADGAVLAALADYAIVRELLAESFTAAQQDGLTPAQREAVQAVETLCAGQGEDGKGVSLSQVARRLGLDKSAASRRLANPLSQGYVCDLAKRPDLDKKQRRGHAAQYVPGEPLPPKITALPTSEAVAAWPPRPENDNASGAEMPATLQHPAESAMPERYSSVAVSVAAGVAGATVAVSCDAAAAESVAAPPPTATLTATPQTLTGTDETAEPLQCCSVADPYDDEALATGHGSPVGQPYPCVGCGTLLPWEAESCPTCEACCGEADGGHDATG